MEIEINESIARKENNDAVIRFTVAFPDGTTMKMFDDGDVILKQGDDVVVLHLYHQRTLSKFVGDPKS